MSEFKVAFGHVIGKGMDERQLMQLFMKIDADSNGSVEWDEFMNYMLLENQTLAGMKKEHFEYVPSRGEDPVPNKKHMCHAKNITAILILTPEMLADNRKSN